LTLRQANQIRTDIANLESGLEIIMAQLARQKGDLARAALGIIFCTSLITTLMTWWFIAHP
jgi:NhaP-type Na+/H+ or K+/H+ antiporter